jgi:hypothetical protein
LIFQEIAFVCVQECGFDSRVPPPKQMQRFEGFECANREATYVGSRLAHSRKVKLNKFGGPLCGWDQNTHQNFVNVFWMRFCNKLDVVFREDGNKKFADNFMYRHPMSQNCWGMFVLWI